MYERDRKKFAKLYAYAMILLSAMLLLISYTPLLRMNLNGQERSEWFNEGSYTGSWDTDSQELELNFGTALQILKNWKELKAIIQVQNLEFEIRALKQNAESGAFWLADEGTIQNKENALRQLRSGRSQEEEAALREMGKDRSFSELLCAFDSCFFGESAETVYSIGSREITSHFGPAVFLVYLAFLILFPAAAAIQMILKAAYLLIQSRKIGQKEMEKLSAVPLCTCYVVMNLVFLFCLLALGIQVECRAGPVAWLIALTVLVCTLNTIRKWVFGKELPEHYLIRQGIAALSLVAVTAAVFGFAGLRLPGQFPQEAERFGARYEQSLLEQSLQEGVPYETALAQAGEAALKAVKGYRCAIFAVVLIGSVGLVLVLSVLLSRFSSAKTVHRSLFPAAILLVVLMIAVPVFFGAGSSAAQERNAQKGQLRVLWDAYRQEGSDANRDYRSALAQQELLTKRMDELTAAVQNGTGREAAELLKEKSECASELAAAEQTIRQMRTHQIGNLTLCIAGAAVFLLSELANMLFPVLAGRGRSSRSSNEKQENG